MKLSIRNRILLSALTFSFLLSVGISVVSAKISADQTLNKYESVGISVTEIIAGRIDGDKIAGYLETNMPDEEYNAVLEEIDMFQKKFNILCLYVVIPEENQLRYVWENGYSGEKVINFTTNYSPGGEIWMNSLMNNLEEKRMKTFKDPEYGSSATIASPVRNSKNEITAFVMADYSMPEINNIIIKLIVNIALFAILFNILTIVAFSMYINKKIVYPITMMTDSIRNMVQNLDSQEVYRSEINTGDELQILSESFEKMDNELRKYLSENIKITAEKERIGTELNMAKSIQESQLPSVFPAFPDRPEFDIYASMTPAKEVGGDFYDFFFVDSNHLAMVMADVSGKGVPAALFMMMSKILINNYAMMGLSPHEVLERTNTTICQNNKQKMFVTVWFGIMEISTGKVTASNAGHEYPIIRHPDGKFELFKDKHGFVIGGMKNKKYKEYEFTMQKGSTLFIYTDGVPEATNTAEELFGTGRLLEVMNQTPEAMPKQLLENVHKAVNTFVGTAPQFDDLTMLGITLL